MEKSRRIAGIDILRAVALIMICFYHWFLYKGMYVGVIVFFALSGYLFTSSLLSRDFSCFDIVRKRISRIYPALLTVILVSTVVLLIMNGGLETKYKNSAFFSIIGLNNIYQIISGISYFDSYNIVLPLTHIWALSFQIQMYILFPFILKGLKRLKLGNLQISFIFFGVSILSALCMAYKYFKGADISRIYYGTDTRAFTFFIGAAVAMIYSQREIKNDREKLRILQLGIGGIVLLIIFSLTIDYRNGINYYGLLYLMSVLITFSAVLCTKLKLRNIKIPMFGFFSKILAILGRHEYHYYLWQYPLMIFMREIFKWSKIGYFYQLLLEILLLILIAEISYYIFEKKRFEISGYLVSGTIIALLFLSPVYKNKDLEEMKAVQSDIENGKIIGENKDGKDNAERDSQEQKDKEKKAENNEEKIENKNQNENQEQTENNSEKNGKIGNIDERNILFIGDSVLEMTKPELYKKYPNAIIDVKVGRQFSELAGLLTEYKNTGKLGKTVVIALGTNGPISPEDAEKVMNILKGSDVYFINSVVARPWEKRVNREIRNIEKNYNNVKIIDWYSYAKGKREYFYKDGVHPKPLATEKYANLVYSVLSKGAK